MSLCDVPLEWGDGNYTFALPLAQHEELERLCDAGLALIAKRLEGGTWRACDIYHTLRLGLIGGGTKPVDALRLCKLYVLDRPWLENLLPAHSIIMGQLVGKIGEPVGKSPAAGEESDPAAPTESSISESSTASEP